MTSLDVQDVQDFGETLPQYGAFLAKWRTALPADILKLFIAHLEDIVREHWEYWHTTGCPEECDCDTEGLEGKRIDNVCLYLVCCKALKRDP